jgi:hypothetical protein
MRPPPPRDLLPALEQLTVERCGRFAAPDAAEDLRLGEIIRHWEDAPPGSQEIVSQASGARSSVATVW